MKIKTIGKFAGYSLLFLGLLAAAGYFTLPVNRINMRSRLVMLGDLNSDNKWDRADAALLCVLTAAPFSAPADTAYKADVNHNGLLDAEDIAFLEELYKTGDPYRARDEFLAKGETLSLIHI